MTGRDYIEFTIWMQRPVDDELDNVVIRMYRGLDVAIPGYDIEYDLAFEAMGGDATRFLKAVRNIQSSPIKLVMPQCGLDAVGSLGYAMDVVEHLVGHLPGFIPGMGMYRRSILGIVKEFRQKQFGVSSSHIDYLSDTASGLLGNVRWPPPDGSWQAAKFERELKELFNELSLYSPDRRFSTIAHYVAANLDNASRYLALLVRAMYNIRAWSHSSTKWKKQVHAYFGPPPWSDAHLHVRVWLVNRLIDYAGVAS